MLCSTIYRPFESMRWLVQVGQRDRFVTTSLACEDARGGVLTLPGLQVWVMGRSVPAGHSRTFGASQKGYSYLPLLYVVARAAWCVPFLTPARLFRVCQGIIDQS
jgi:hypothetical protein